jgi:hypothetical protein
MATKVEKNSEKSVKLLSNEKLGEKLYAEKVSFEEAVKQFCKYYKTKQNITDKKFVEARTKIYLRIAELRSKKSEEVTILNTEK